MRSLKLIKTSFSSLKPSSLIARPLIARSFSTSPALFNKTKHDMFCFQCEQTQSHTGCTTVGVCGKTPECAGLQDLLNFQSRRLAVYATECMKLGYPAEKLYAKFDEFQYAPYETLTNVNFDEKRFHSLLKKVSQLIVDTKTLYESLTKTPKKFEWILKDSLDFRKQLIWDNVGQKYVADTIVGVENRKKTFGDDITGLEELLQYGLKGYSAYSTEGNALGQFDPKVFAFSQEALASLADVEGVKKDGDAILGMSLKCGEMNLRSMELLDAGGDARFGTPSPHQVRITPVVGKCILVSGHSIGDLEAVLKATEGKGINVYTHGELLPAHGYPSIRKYKHLVGNYGGAWQLQKIEFSNFPGSILVTSNCIQDPHKRYSGRIFTIGAVGVRDSQHLALDNLKPLVDAALAEKGFTEDSKDVKAEPKFIQVGFGHKAVLGMADVIVNAVKKGDLKHFYLIGGCDGHESERSHFRNLALGLPKDNVVMTMGCAKFRFNKGNFGTIKTTLNNEVIEIPRLLDLGQCNDSYSAIKIATALADAFKCDINSLPLSYGISWFEQKAVVVFLSMMYLGIKNIELGPVLPAFIPPSTLNLLVQKFGVRGIPTMTK